MCKLLHDCRSGFNFGIYSSSNCSMHPPIIDDGSQEVYRDVHSYRFDRLLASDAILKTHPIDHSLRRFPFVFVHVGDLAHLNIFHSGCYDLLTAIEICGNAE